MEKYIKKNNDLTRICKPCRFQEDVIKAPSLGHEVLYGLDSIISVFQRTDPKSISDIVCLVKLHYLVKLKVLRNNM